jgi:hypothetical protein
MRRHDDAVGLTHAREKRIFAVRYNRFALLGQHVRFDPQRFAAKSMPCLYG